MVKQIILLLVSVCFFCESYSQKLSIELSIEWKYEESDIYNELGFNNVPFLKIRYNNLTSDSTYLPKVYDNKFDIPQFPIGTTSMGNYRPYSIEEIQLRKANEASIVLIGGMPIPHNTQWVVLPDTIDCSEDYEVGEINQMLSDIYDSVFQLNVSNSEISDQIMGLQENQISGELKDSFVFLLPHSNQVDYYDLLGFRAIGGRYSFALSVNEISSFIHTTPSWSNVNEKWEFKEIPLPEKVGDYQLYSGFFYTNKIEIEF